MKKRKRKRKVKRNKYHEQAKAARERRKRIRGCLNKKSYEDTEAEPPKGQRYYECEYCGLYHRTSNLYQYDCEPEKV